MSASTICCSLSGCPEKSLGSIDSANLMNSTAFMLSVISGTEEGPGDGSGDVSSGDPKSDKRF